MKIAAAVIISALSCFASTCTYEDLHERVFTHIYDHAVWGRNSEGIGFSGGGSLLKNAQAYIDFLVPFMKEHRITSVVDVGCGDWEFSRFIDWSGIQYIGYDVVKSVIEKNIKRYGSPNTTFVHANMLTEELPPADLLLCKDVLQHLTNKDIGLFLPQFKKYKYCLITNEVDPKTLSSDNQDTQIGGAHKIDLRRPPFNVQGTIVLNYHLGDDFHQIFLIDNSLDETRAEQG